MTRALPWATALGGVSLAAWSLLRPQRTGPRNDGTHLDLADPEHAAYLTGIAEAVLRAQQDQEPDGDGRRAGIRRIALVSRPGPVEAAGHNALTGQDRPAFTPVPVQVGALHVRRHARAQDGLLVDVLRDKLRRRQRDHVRV